MQQSTDLQNMLHSIHRKSYPAYKSLKGAYQFGHYILSVDHVQGDPFASPSHISIRVSHKTAGFPEEYLQNPVTKITLCDYLTRQFEQQINRFSFRAKGSGKSGLISVSHCGQEVLKRTACEITDQGITARFFIGFPANGRTVNSFELEKILFDFLPICVQKAFLYKNLDAKKLEEAIFLAEDQAYIREQLKKEALAVTVGNKNIYELTALSIENLKKFLAELKLTEQQELIGRQILKEVRARVGFLAEVGLDYLSLGRATATLSGGEAQRIRLATQIGSGLVGVAYILDEPSIGLHQRDNDKLLKALMRLRDLGNSLIVVEHDEDTMRAADCVVDIGPGAGEHGGKLVAMGTAEDLMKNENSITGAYLSGKCRIPIPEERKKPTGWLKIRGASENNLKQVNVDIPLGILTCVTGVSGSGKSSLINEVLYKTLARDLNRARIIPGKHKEILGLEELDKVISIDQSPIGRTPRSNPATYTGVFDQIRDLFASTADAKARGYKKGRFSFNVKGGRCEACSGDGIIKIEMHFLSDVYVPCEVCKGKRYNRETLEVKYKDKNIYDVLNMTVEEALGFFENIPSIRRKIQTLYDVGLSYIRLGQPSTELSGGEAQRIKLATELSRRSTGKTIYILDEPTTGLHFADVHKLVDILKRLADGGNTVVVIEHNLDVIKTADYIIDMGPEGGDRGGTVIAKGTPEEIVKIPESYTGQYVARYLKQ